MKKYIILLIILFIGGIGYSQTDTEEEAEEEEVKALVEIMPAFPGCEDEKRADIVSCTNDAIINFLKENVKYPQDCVDNNIKGKVWIYYEINKEGNVQKVKILKSIDPQLDAEALRVINALPKHKPGSQQGKNVTVSYRIPINFLLTGK